MQNLNSNGVGIDLNENYSDFNPLKAVNTINNVPTVYQCTVGGWCSQTAVSSAYIPGTGWAWQQAWSQIATCLVATTNINKAAIHIAPNPFYTQKFTRI